MNRILGHYLTLILYQSYADLRAESQRTYIGYLWWVVDPVISMGVYYIVFEVVLDRGIENYSIFLFVGLIPWRWLQTSILSGANSILHSRGVMLQVYLPKAIFPAVNFLSNTVKFLSVFTLLAIILVLAGFPVTSAHAALPVLLLVTALLITGCTFIASSVTPFFPDLRMVLDNIVRLWFFLSGIFYPMSDLPERLEWYFRLNPMATLIESYRHILLDGRWPDLAALGLIGVFGVVLNAIGLTIISRYDYVYPRLSS